MAGGSGTRFWPISTSKVPKQFQIVEGTDKTFIQTTRSRFDGLVPPERTIVVTNRKYVPQVRENLPDIPQENILAEPYSRDTAPCIAYAMYTILKRDPSAIMIVTPSDHLILGLEKFHKTISFLSEGLHEYDVLVTMGISPTRPDTNYGYIQVDGLPEEGTPIKVKTFTEKPDAELAKVFVSSGEFLWNSGIFIWRAATIRSEMEKYLPQLVSQFTGWEKAIGTPAEEEFIEKAYAGIEKISIDYGVMEHTDMAWTCPCTMGWYDVGTWESLYSVFPDTKKDADGNAVSAGALMAQNSHDNIVIGADKSKLVALCDLDGYVVVDTGSVLMVGPRNDKRLRDFTSGLLKKEYEKYR